MKEEPPAPVKLTPEEVKLLEAHYLKKMNKKERVKHQARKDAKTEAEKIKEELAKSAKSKKKEEIEAKNDDTWEKLLAGPMARTKKTGTWLDLLLSAPTA